MNASISRSIVGQNDSRNIDQSTNVHGDLHITNLPQSNSSGETIDISSLKEIRDSIHADVENIPRFCFTAGAEVRCGYRYLQSSIYLLGVLQRQKSQPHILDKFNTVLRAHQCDYLDLVESTSGVLASLTKLKTARLFKQSAFKLYRDMLQESDSTQLDRSELKTYRKLKRAREAPL